MKATGKSETSIKRAALTNMVTRYSAAFLSMCYSILLARLLTPGDVGVVAIAQVFVTFFALFQDMGLGSAIIQRQDLDEDDISKIYAFTVMVSIVLGVLVAVGGIPLSIVYRENELRPICAALSLTTIFSTLNAVPNALLVKSRRFLAVGIRQIVSVVVASAAGLTAAFMGAGPYSIVIYSIVNSLINLVWNYRSYPIKPIFKGMMGPIKSVFGYTSYVFLFNMVTYFTRNSDNMLIGYYFGKAPLGNYQKAYQLMQYPQTYLTSVVTGVLHPMLAKYQEDVKRIYGVYVRLEKALSLLGVFISVLCLFESTDIVALLYGEKWLDSAECLKYLSISVWCQMITGTSGAMFQLLNKTREQFIRGLIIGVVVIGSILIGVRVGSIEAVALGVGISYWIAFILMLPLLIRDGFGESISSFLKLFIPEVIIAAVLSVLLYELNMFYGTDALSFFIKLSFATLAYIVLMKVLKQFRWLSMFIPKRFRS